AFAGLDHLGGVAEYAAVDELHIAGIDGLGARRHPVGAVREVDVANGKGRSLVDGADLERDGLEVAATVAGRDETDLLRFRGYVVGALEVADGSGFAALHGVVGEDVEPRHEVLRGDRGCGRLCSVLERERRGRVGNDSGRRFGGGRLLCSEERGRNHRGRDYGDPFHGGLLWGNRAKTQPGWARAESVVSGCR